MTEHVLVSPLGFAPGAVSGVYFALEKYEKLSMDKVITVGTRHDAVRDAAAKLETLFRRVGGVTYEACYIDATDLKGREQDASGPFAARMGLYVDRAHRAEQTVHVAVTGGRSGMGALAALAAQLYRADHLYHLWVDEEIERLGIIEARPDPKNRYVNPTVEDDLCELVSLPFTDLSQITEAAKEYRSQGESPANWAASRLVGEGPPMLEAVANYVPAGLSIASAQELLSLVEQWRDQVEWIAKDVPDETVEALPTIDEKDQNIIWRRALSILYTAGALDDATRADFRDLMRDSIAEPYSQRALDKAGEADDLGPFEWLVENKDGIAVLTDMVTASVTVGTFVLKVVSLWLEMGAP
jgi:hypothetical protein